MSFDGQCKVVTLAGSSCTGTIEISAADPSHVAGTATGVTCNDDAGKPVYSFSGAFDLSPCGVTANRFGGTAKCCVP